MRRFAGGEGTRPDPETLGRAPMHVVVRDFPETLAVFRAHGVPVDAAGGEPARAHGAEATGALLAELARVTAWRRAPG